MRKKIVGGEGRKRMNKMVFCYITKRVGEGKSENGRRHVTGCHVARYHVSSRGRPSGSRQPARARSQKKHITKEKGGKRERERERGRKKKEERGGGNWRVLQKSPAQRRTCEDGYVQHVRPNLFPRPRRWCCEARASRGVSFVFFSGVLVWPS